MTEYGYRDCRNFIAYTQAKFNDLVTIRPPGMYTVFGWFPADAQWHIWQHDGLYYGNWQAWGSNYLDYPNTYAACRNYG